MSAESSILVYDANGESRMVPDDEYAALNRDGLAVDPCPNDEEDEAAGWHGHIHTAWEEFDARVLTT